MKLENINAFAQATKNIKRGETFTADGIGLSGSTCSAMAKRKACKVVGTYPVTVTKPDGDTFERQANIYKLNRRITEKNASEWL